MSARPQGRRHRRLGRRGATSLEFALVSLPLMLLLLGGMELARYAATVASLRAVTDAATRTATLRGYANLIAGRGACDGLAAGGSMVAESTPTFILQRTRLSITIDTCATNGTITTVGMTARYRHDFAFAVLAPASGTLVETSAAAFH
jgi:Flp pilus assembly protein TadG